MLSNQRCDGFKLVTVQDLRSDDLWHHALVAITDETRKRLWGRSRNRCTPCCQDLIRADAGEGSGALIGQEAHIIARSPSGSRYESGHPEDRDGYDNPILLCANDHLEVVTQSAHYTVERLRSMKHRHELDALTDAGFVVLGGQRIGAWTGGEVIGKIAVLEVIRPADLEDLAVQAPKASQ